MDGFIGSIGSNTLARVLCLLIHGELRYWEIVFFDALVEAMQFRMVSRDNSVLYSSLIKVTPDIPGSEPYKVPSVPPWIRAL